MSSATYLHSMSLPRAIRVVAHAAKLAIVLMEAQVAIVSTKLVAVAREDILFPLLAILLLCLLETIQSAVVSHVRNPCLPCLKVFVADMAVIVVIGVFLMLLHLEHIGEMLVAVLKGAFDFTSIRHIERCHSVLSGTEWIIWYEVDGEVKTSMIYEANLD